MLLFLFTKMKITYKYKLYRSRKNKYLHKTINLTGKAYNHCIALHKRYYKLTGSHLNQYTLMRHLTKLKKLPKYSWLKLIPSQALQDVVQRIERGYRLFFDNSKHNLKMAPPTFRKVSKFKSYTLKQAGWKIVEGNKVQIGGNTYKLCKDRPLTGDIKTVTIKRSPLNDLYLCFTLDIPEPTVQPMSGKMAGFDFGLKTFLTVYDGAEVYKIESPEFFKRELNEVSQANRNLSRKVKGSRNQYKASMALAKVHQRIANRRLDWFFKLANELTDRYDHLFFETLNLRGMAKLWGRKIHDLSFGLFLDILRWVAQKKGAVVHCVDRFFASSKICNHCGYSNSNLSLSDRQWRCPECNEVNDRDGNAAKNIYQEGVSSCGRVDVRPELPGLSALTPEFPYAPKLWEVYQLEPAR